jgi:hypothetical protein
MSQLTFKTEPLTLAEARDFTRIASTLCFTNEGTYIPELRNFAFKYAVLAFCTDYEPLKKDIEEVYKFVYGDKDIYDDLSHYEQNNSQIIDLYFATEYMIDEKNKPFSVGQALINLLSSDKIDEIMNIFGGIVNDSLSENSNTSASETQIETE